MTEVPPFVFPQDLQSFYSQSSVEQFKQYLSHSSIYDLAESFFLLQQGPNDDSKRKQDEIFQFIDHPSKLESFGKFLIPNGFIGFLNYLDQHPAYAHRLQYVLIGLNPSVFSQALCLFQEHHIALLNHECFFEPLQYHLTQFVHQDEEFRKQIELTIEQLTLSFQTIQTEELTSPKLEALFTQIDKLKEILESHLNCINKALAIVWHTNRIDLIERLSVINGTFQYLLNHAIGQPQVNDHPPTGLYFALQQGLSKIFDASLEDRDAAIEGLTRLSIWHLKDYWELGLLPSIKRAEEFDLDPQYHPEDERSAHQQNLFTSVQNTLDRLHIGTVGALKKKNIFSKELLKAYITEHQHLL